MGPAPGESELVVLALAQAPGVAKLNYDPLGDRVVGAQITGTQCGDPSGDPTGDVLLGEPHLGEHLGPGCVWSRNRCGTPRSRHGTSTSAARSAAETEEPTPPATPLSSQVTTSLCERASGTSAAGTGSTQRGSTTVTPMPWVRSRWATFSAIGANAPTATSSTSPLCETVRRAGQNVDAGKPLERRNVLPHFAFGKRMAVGPSLTSSASPVPHAAATSRGAATRIPGMTLRIDMSHAAVAGAVVSGDPGPVQHQGDRQLVQRHVHHDLIEGPVEEGRIDRHHRVHAAHRQPGRRGHRVLLGDADVEEPVGELLTEFGEPGRTGHTAVMATMSRRAPA